MRGDTLFWFELWQRAARLKRATYIEPPDVPTTSPRQFYSRMNALLMWCNAHGQ